MRSSLDYVPRRPAESALYQVVHEHFETFLVRASSLRDGEGLPGFVEEEFRAFLRCGWLAGGFARFRCASCGLDRLVAFSCKGRGFCPSCGGRRMAERAAHLVDAVLPDVPVRQWVLSLPHRLRYHLAWRHDACRAVVGVFMTALLRQLREAARRRGVAAGRGGGVAIIQRFGGALNLNIHVHALALDGVYADAEGGVRFHPIVPSDLDVAEVLAVVQARVAVLLEREGLSDGDDSAGDGWEGTPVLGGLAAASLQGTQALGPHPRRRIRRVGGDDRAEVLASGSGPRYARADGFDLHANVRIPAGHRDRLEAVCRYALRPPIADERIRMTSDGQVLLELRRPWADGTTHLVFDPLDFLGRLAVLVPRPRINLLLYYGVLGARAAWRQQIVPVADAHEAADVSTGDRSAGRSGRGYLWAELMRRTFGFDVLECPRCALRPAQGAPSESRGAGRLRLVALIEDAGIAARILRHLGLPATVPPPPPARPPPGLAGAS